MRSSTRTITVRGLCAYAHLLLATTYTNEALAAFRGTAQTAAAMCGLVWSIVGSSSAIAAIVALGLSPFTDMASFARRLGRFAFWGGAIAVALGLSAAVFVASDRDLMKFDSALYRHSVATTLMTALLSGIVPLVAIGALFWSDRMDRHADGNEPNYRARSGCKAGAELADKH